MNKVLVIVFGILLIIGGLVSLAWPSRGMPTDVFTILGGLVVMFLGGNVLSNGVFMPSYKERKKASRKEAGLE